MTPGDERIDGYANALFEVARVEGSLHEVEDELFRFARTLESNDELRSVLTDADVPAQRRMAVVQELLGERASAKDSVVGEVRSAIPLTEDQQTRLADALGKATGKKVELKVVVDPSVLGGIVAQVGDTVIDGSVRARLDQLRESIG